MPAFHNTEKDTYEILIAWPESEPAAHLHKGVSRPGNTPVVTYGESLDRVSPRKLVSADDNLPNRGGTEIWRGRYVTIHHNKNMLTFFDSLDSFRQMRNKFCKGSRQDIGTYSC